MKYSALVNFISFSMLVTFVVSIRAFSYSEEVVYLLAAVALFTAVILTMYKAKLILVMKCTKFL